MPCQFADCVDWVWVIHEHKPAHHGVKWPVEAHFCRVAFGESYVADVSRLRPHRRPVHGCGSAVDADDLSARSGQLSGKKGYVSGATTHVKNPHARGDPSFLE